jgi:hypothetical protein
LDGAEVEGGRRRGKKRENKESRKKTFYSFPSLAGGE